MNVANQPSLKFHGVNFVDVHFRALNQYDNKTGIDLKVEPKVFYPSQEDSLVFRIIMDVKLSCPDFFDIKLLAIGDFEFDKEFPDNELKKSFINANAPAIMFPYVRAFVANLTANVGNITGTLNIPTQFFSGDLPEHLVEDIEE